MGLILVDTHYLIAIINRFDQWHRSALEITPKFAGSTLVVTESVFVETLNFFSEFRMEAKGHAAETIEKFASNPRTDVIEQSSDLVAAGLTLYKARLDKGYSLTDCISMVVGRNRRIRNVLTNDNHFRQEGFQILFQSE